MSEAFESEDRGTVRRGRPYKAGQKVADEIIAEDPPSDKQYTRDDLMRRGGFEREGSGGFTEMGFFEGLNDRLMDKAGRMFKVAGPGLVTFTTPDETVPVSEGAANRKAARALNRHVHVVETVIKHLSPTERAEAAESAARAGRLAQQIRWAQNEAAKFGGTK